jgi:hypothetical protein
MSVDWALAAAERVNGCRGQVEATVYSPPYSPKTVAFRGLQDIVIRYEGEPQSRLTLGSLVYIIDETVQIGKYLRKVSLTMIHSLKSARRSRPSDVQPRQKEFP